MSIAHQQYRTHIERQRRLGKDVMPAATPVMVPAQTGIIDALRRQVAQLSAKLKAMEREDQTPLVTPARIKPVVRAVAKYYGVSLGDIVSSRRARGLIRPRQVAMYLARELTGHSLPAIGRVLDRDHTTVLHGCRRIAALRREDPVLDREIALLAERLMPGVRHG